jgi:hypothetical protein
MTSNDVLAEYGAQSNVQSVCLDGPKRDRLVWLGDMYHTMRIIGASTGRQDLARSTLDFLLASQLANGQLNICPPMGYDPTINKPFAPNGIFYLEDYQFLGVSAFYSYIRLTNDMNFLQTTWPKWLLVVDYILSTIDESTGLVSLTVAFLGPATEGSAASCAAAQALRELSELAESIGDSSTQARCTAAFNSLSGSINKLLWNDDLGIFSLSTSDTTNFSVAGTAFCITSGVASTNQTAKVISALEELALLPGYKDSTADSSADPDVIISPNTNGFLLDALFNSGAWNTGQSLIRSLWGAMISDPKTTSGGSWEYVDQSGNPGYYLFTSLAHPWGGAPTYILTEWAAGIQTFPGLKGFGYGNWVVSPAAGLAMGISRASANVETPYGSLSVAWELVSGTLNVTIDAPLVTNGTFKFNNETIPLCGKTKYALLRRI